MRIEFEKLQDVCEYKLELESSRTREHIVRCKINDMYCNEPSCPLNAEKECTWTNDAPSHYTGQCGVKISLTDSDIAYYKYCNNCGGKVKII